MPAAAHPEYELSMERTTGISAPPIGMMISTPSKKDSSATAQKYSAVCSRQNITMQNRRSSASAMLMTWRPGNMIGLPDMRPESMNNATTEPEKVMAPIAQPSDISTRLAVYMAPGVP